MIEPLNNTNCDLLGTFQRHHLDRATRRLLYRGLKMFNELQQPINPGCNRIRYRFWTDLLHRYFRAARRDGLTSVIASPAAGHPRPFRVLVALDFEDEVLFPTDRAADFLKLADLLHLQDITQIVILHGLIFADYGVMAKRSLPQQILSRADARACGFDLTDYLDSYPGAGTTLWWERWGGLLYTFTLIRDLENPVREAKLLARGVGNHECLPGRCCR